MAEKKYVGKAVQGNYGIKVKFDVNQLFKNLINEKNKVTASEVYKQLILLLKNQPFINSWINKEGKMVYEIKLELTERKEKTQYQTHNLTLDEFIPKKKEESKESQEEKSIIPDDLPF